MQIKNIKTYVLALVLAAAGWTGCNIEEVPDPNNPSLAPILEDATANELQAVRTKLLTGHCFFCWELPFSYWND